MNWRNYGSRALALGCMYTLMSSAGPAFAEPAAEIPMAAPASTNATLERPPLAPAITFKPRPAQKEKEEVPPSAFGSKLVNAGGFMLAVMLLGIGLQRHFSKKNNTGGDRGIAIDVISRQVIGQRQSLLVVEVAGQRLLLGQSAESVTMLTSLDSGSEFTETISELLPPEPLIERPRRTSAA